MFTGDEFVSESVLFRRAFWIASGMLRFQKVGTFEKQKESKLLMAGDTMIRVPSSSREEQTLSS
jgi:hypothetical protein